VDKLRRALASVDQQSFRDFEVWLVDDGSTDGTRDFLESSQLRQIYPNIPSINTLVNEQGRGAAAARNQALARARGELIAFLDDDDVWLPGFLQQQVKRLDSHPEAAASCARHVEFDASGRSYQPDLLPLFEYEHPLIYLLSESFVHTMSVFVCRSEAFGSIGLLDERLGIVHDWEWCARLLISGNSILTPGGPVLARHEIPGGLVTRQREWYEEEQGVLDRVFRANAEYSNKQLQVRAHRALFFARIGLLRKDYAFAARRLVEAFCRAPLRSMKIIILRMNRNVRSATSGARPNQDGSILNP
jgi:glycosyltransferase involved in cell wall biosynthesis